MLDVPVLRIDSDSKTSESVNVVLVKRMIEQWASSSRSHTTGSPFAEAFRRVDPPVTVLVDLAALFPREPHRAGGYNPVGLQMHSVVEGRLDLLGHLRAGRLVGTGHLRDRLWDTTQVGDPLATIDPTPAHVTVRRTQPPGDRSSRWWREVRGW